MTDTMPPPLNCGEAVPLSDCPPGLFWSGRAWGLKTEYMTESQSDGLFYPEAYVVETGEYWWGGFSTHPERARQMVHPITVEMPAPQVQMADQETTALWREWDGYINGLTRAINMKTRVSRGDEGSRVVNDLREQIAEEIKRAEAERDRLGPMP